jgi:hypothetical protein
MMIGSNDQVSQYKVAVLPAVDQPVPGRSTSSTGNTPADDVVVAKVTFLTANN